MNKSLPIKSGRDFCYPMSFVRPAGSADETDAFRGTSRIGIAGTGFIARQALRVLRMTGGASVTRMLTRRAMHTVTDVDPELLTNDLDDVIESADVIFEATGDPIHGTVVVERALRAGRRVVTMNTELHVTTGSYLADLGYLTEAEGDQPGATALLRNEALAMGFEPLAYVNVKGFLDENPSRADMEYWSRHQGLSLPETVSFTDGTKVQYEQAFCANAFDATIARNHLIGREVDDLVETDFLVEESRRVGQPICDFVKCPTAPPGVFLLAEHEMCRALPNYGPYAKLLSRRGQGYVLLRPYHLCGLEVAKSIMKTVNGLPPLMTNGSKPSVSIAAVAKRALKTDEVLRHPIGSFEVRGSCVKTVTVPDHVPLGLLHNARLTRDVPPGQVLTFDDVELPESRALSIWTDELLPRLSGGSPGSGLAPGEVSALR